MIEKEVFFEDKENKKAALFYIKADNPKEFFKHIKQLEEELKTHTSYDLKASYNLMILDMKESLNSAPQVQKSTHNMMM